MNTHTTPLSPLDYIPAEIACARDYVSLAQTFIPADILAYISGGSGQDITLRNNEKAFHRWAITPRVMPAPENATTGIQLFGKQFQHPLLLAPVAYQTLVHPQGELATAYAAESTDTCMLASTLASVTLERIAQRSTAERWFQLYFQPRQEDTNALIQRAIAAGYQAIVVTLDAAIQTPSLRAVRAGFKRPETVKAANLVDPVSDTPRQHNSSESRIFRSRRDNAPTLQQLQQLIDESPVPVIIKGVLHPEDAGQLQQSGAAAMIVSNHGGRTLDGAPASLSVLPAIRAMVGDQYPLLFDSGIRSGSDVFKAIALGADAVLIGRLQLYALSVAGALGVAHMIKLLREELELCMAMSGCAALADIRATELQKPF